jgi:O-antigen ligase
MQIAPRNMRPRTRPRRVAFRPEWLPLVLLPLVAWWAGSAVAAGGTRAFLAIAVGCAAGGATLVALIPRDRLRADFAAVELPVLLILLSELVFRERDAESLASNPLDPAGLFRVACTGLALLLGILALTSPASGVEKERITTRPFRIYCLYVFVVFVGAPLSINLPLTAYRGIELLVGVVVVMGAYRRVGKKSTERILALFYWFAVASVVLIWLGALVVPGSAFDPVDSPFPVQLQGVFPVVSSNGTGMLGATIALWSFARLLSPQDRGSVGRRTLAIVAALGFATLVLAQYRTGFIATGAGLLVLLAFRNRAAAFWVVMAGILVATLWGPAIGRIASPLWQRGENAEVLSDLSGRLTYWESALPVWRESPWFGRGLLTASRFEVLAKIGATYTSGIHGTWVEALVGTGLIGLSLLAVSFLLTSVRALKEAARPGGLVVPLILLTILAVRSITGTTFEIAGNGSLLLMTIALLLRDPPMLGRRDRAWTGSLAARD